MNTNKKRFITGSTAFFSGRPGFNSKDIDIIEFIDNPTDFDVFKQHHFNRMCLFQYKMMSTNDLINYTLCNQPSMCVCIFLTLAVVKYLNLSIEQLKLLQPMIDDIDKRHTYLSVIYNAYIENGEFRLTKEQLDLAYETYLKYRGY